MDVAWRLVLPNTSRPVERLGRQGAALAAYFCRELAANARVHGEVRSAGQIEVARDGRMQIRFPDRPFDSCRTSATGAEIVAMTAVAE